MSLKTAPLPGETIAVGATDAATQARFFQSARSQPQHQGRQAQGPVLPQIRQFGGEKRPQPFRTRFDQTKDAHPNAAGAASGVIHRMAVAVWPSGWWNETLEMLQAFAALDGRQDRRIILTDTEALPCPNELINAAQAAFTEVHVYRTPFTMQNGTSAPRTLFGLAGHIAEKLRHVGSIMFMMPMLPSQPGSLDRLEKEHQDGMMAGRKILGVIVGQGDERQPYGTFVAHREWIYDPNFPLAQGIGMNAESNHAMKYLRIEFLRSFRPTLSLLAVPGLPPDRNTMLKAFDLSRSARERPLIGTVHTPRPQTTLSPNDELDQLIQEAEQGGPVQPPVQEIQESVPETDPVEYPDLVQAPELPDDATVKARVAAEGLWWIGAEGYSESFVARGFTNPAFLPSIAATNAAFVRRAQTAHAHEALAATPPPPKVETVETIAGPVPKTGKKHTQPKNPPKPGIRPLVM